MNRKHTFPMRVVLILLATFSIQAAGKQTILGIAHDQESGEFLYSESHVCSQDALQCSVEYRDLLGTLIAEKKLDYSTSLFRPALHIHDYRRAVELEIGFSERQDLVVDAGFDHFIRSKWSHLANGESVRFPFQVIGYENPLKMHARIDDTSSCPVQELCLAISLDSWLLGLVTDPIALSYSRSDRRLLRYRGPSNIQGEDGSSLNVLIEYQYSGNASTQLHSRTKNISFYF